MNLEGLKSLQTLLQIELGHDIPIWTKSAWRLAVCWPWNVAFEINVNVMTKPSASVPLNQPLSPLGSHPLNQSTRLHLWVNNKHYIWFSQRLPLFRLPCERPATIIETLQHMQCSNCVSMIVVHAQEKLAAQN